MATDDQTQRITRLTPLADVLLAHIDGRVRPVAAYACPLAHAHNQVLAEDAIIPIAIPTGPRALHDGYAVRSEETTDASSYAPAPLATTPKRVDLGYSVMPEADAVAPLDAVVEWDGRWQASAPISPGEGLIARGADFAAKTVLRRAGHRLRTVDATALTAAAVSEVRVRTPSVSLVWRHPGRDPAIEAVVHMIRSGIRAAGGDALLEGVPDGSAAGSWEAPFREAEGDFIVAVGSILSPSTNDSVRLLARIGAVAVHGIAISPGESAAFGFIDGRPVLLVPGLADAAFAVWQLIGWRILARLSGCIEDAPVVNARLMRKVSSALGLAEVVPVRLREGAAEPIASGYLPLSALVEADGWILIPPESEGYPPGAEVVIRPCA